MVLFPSQNHADEVCCIVSRLKCLWRMMVGRPRLFYKYTPPLFAIVKIPPFDEIAKNTLVE